MFGFLFTGAWCRTSRLTGKNILQYSMFIYMFKHTKHNTGEQIGYKKFLDASSYT